MLRLIRFELIMCGYIILRVITGLTDGLSMLWTYSNYAKEHNRTIIFCLSLYSATNLDDLLDFSEFPVPVLCGESHIKNITFSKIEPSCYELDPYKRCNTTVKVGDLYIPSIGTTIAKFDMNKAYSDDVLLMFEGFGNDNNAIESLKHIKLRRKLLAKFYRQRNVFLTTKIPLILNKKKDLNRLFISIHLRATDYPGYDEDSDIANVDNFIAEYPDDLVYLASDNYKLIEKICSRHSNIVVPLSYKKTRTNYHALHYSFGKYDPECLSDAIVDLLVCAYGYRFLQSRGGFSRLIADLYDNKKVLKKLIEL